MILFLFAAVSFLLSVFTPLGLLPCALSLAISWAELNVGWARLSAVATRFVYGAVGFAASGLAVQGLLRLVRLW